MIISERTNFAMPRPPDPSALRRDRKDDPAWTRLTHRDPSAAVPEFPLADPSPRVLHWWEYHWKTPQADQWERGREHVTVALFCQVLSEAEKPNAPVTIHRPLKQLRDELGLSVDGLKRRRWHLPDDPAASATRPATVTPINGPAGRTRPRSSAKDRFNIIAAPPADDDKPPF
jgi:hypothetical protein